MITFQRAARQLYGWETGGQDLGYPGGGFLDQVQAAVIIFIQVILQPQIDLLLPT